MLTQSETLPQKVRVEVLNQISVRGNISFNGDVLRLGQIPIAKIITTDKVRYDNKERVWEDSVGDVTVLWLIANMDTTKHSSREEAILAICKFLRQYLQLDTNYSEVTTNLTNTCAI